MTTPDSKTLEEAAGIPKPGHAVEVAAGTLGAIGGAAAGAIGGPIGAIVGAVIGGAMGATGGWAAEQQSAEQSTVDAELDEAIGVTSGTVGSSNLIHPPSVVNAPSIAASGAAGLVEGGRDADGPILVPPD